MNNILSRYIYPISSLRGWFIFLLPVLVVLFALLTALFVVMFCGVEDSAGKDIAELVDLEKKNEILKFLGIGIGGVLFILQVMIANRRATALEETARTQAKATEEQAKANQNTEQGQRQERLKNAIEHLGHDKDSVRLGGAYELFHLAEDTKELRQTILDILCAHIRRTTRQSTYSSHYALTPSEEIQSLLTLLFVQKHDVFKGRRVNLRASWLNGADLNEARLEKADLTGAHLRGASLPGAHLQGARLWEAYLQIAFLHKAYLQGAILVGAHLQGAALHGAHLQGADTKETHLQEANLVGTHLEGVGSWNWNPVEYFEERIRKATDKKTVLSGVVFSGGLSQEDVDSLVQGLPDEKAKELREKLKPHIGKPASHELRATSGAIIGAYTKEEAEQWIAEYNEAMSEVPEEIDS